MGPPGPPGPPGLEEPESKTGGLPLSKFYSGQEQDISQIDVSTHTHTHTTSLCWRCWTSCCVVGSIRLWLRAGGSCHDQGPGEDAVSSRDQWKPSRLLPRHCSLPRRPVHSWWVATCHHTLSVPKSWEDGYWLVVCVCLYRTLLDWSKWGLTKGCHSCVL